MSFTFRNLFSEEGEDSVPETPEGAETVNPDSIFSAPTADGARGEAPTQSGPEAKPERTQSFLVSELLPFIPPAISAKSGIPMEDELILPMPVDGSNDVKLSVVYQVCPQLFAAEITPLNDSTITLPAKLEVSAGGEEESAVSLSGIAFGANLFSADEDSEVEEFLDEVALEAKGDSEADADNPFWSPEPLCGKTKDAAVESKEASGDELVDDPLGGFSVPKEALEPIKKDEPSFGFTGFDAPAGAKFEPAAEQASKGFESPSGFTAPSEELPKKVDEPEEAVTSDAKDAEPAPFSGSAFDNTSGGFSTLFTKQADRDSEISFPGAEQEQAPAEGSGTWGSMFEAGFSESSGTDSMPIPGGFGDMLKREAQAEEETKEKAPKPEAESVEPELVAEPAAEEAAEEPQADEKKSDTFGFAAAQATVEAKSFEQEVAQGFDAPAETAAAEDAGPEPALANGFSGFDGAVVSDNPDEAPTAETHFESEVPSDQPTEEVAAEELEPNPFQTVSQEASVSEPEVESNLEEKSQGVTIQVAQNVGAKAVSFSQPSVQPKPQEQRINPELASVHVGAMGFAASGSPAEGDEMPDLEMRAIFSSSDTFTLSRVARKIVELPGMQGCALATPMHFVRASRSEESRLGDEAQEMIQSVKNLAKLTGLPDARSFTLQTDRGIVSLFMEGTYCLIVRHDSPEFGPGIREKLIVIARVMHKLND